jgi:hypothetical protein
MQQQHRRLQLFSSALLTPTLEGSSLFVIVGSVPLIYALVMGSYASYHYVEHLQAVEHLLRLTSSQFCHCQKHRAAVLMSASCQFHAPSATTCSTVARRRSHEQDDAVSPNAGAYGVAAANPLHSDHRSDSCLSR